MAKGTINNAEISSQNYKEYFDKKAKYRKFEKGAEVWIMLPNKSNKFLMQWKGPYNIVNCHANGVDYDVKVGNRIKLYHANMFKCYFWRNKVGLVQQSDLCHSNSFFQMFKEMVVATLQSLLVEILEI